MTNLNLTQFNQIPLNPTGKTKIGKVILTVLGKLLKGYARPALVMLIAHIVKATTKNPQDAVEFITEVLEQFDADGDGIADN